MSNYLGNELKRNLMAGRPTRTKSAGDYIGMPVPPCGDFAPRTLSVPRSPWLQSGSTTSLHQEITCFVEYMTPTAREIATRKDLVNRFTKLIASFKMNATVCPVGSYVTGLYLPTSDIDMVLIPKSQATSIGFISSYVDLRGIYRKILASGFASNVDAVLNASVPLIRITDKITGIEIDLTTADTHGVKATQAVERWLQKDTSGIVKMLILIIKVFLSIRKCGTTYTGGINSYVLVWMVVAWFKLEWMKGRKAAPPPEASSLDLASLGTILSGLSLHSPGPLTGSSTVTSTQARAPVTESEDFGEALKGFLKFYGHDFDYFSRAIKIEPTPSYQVKVYSYSRYVTTQRYLLSISDPANSSIDMGAKAYAIKHVQASFQEAYRVLINAETRLEGAGHSSGILSKVLGGDFTKFTEKRSKMTTN